MKKNFRTSIGGQALIEGVMMRGPAKYAAVVASPDGFKVKEESAPYPKDKHPVLGWVFIRGVCNFVQSMKIGMSCLFWSAEQVPLEEPAASAENTAPVGNDTRIVPPTPAIPAPLSSDGEAAKNESAPSFGKGMFAGSMILALLLVVGLFTVLPTFLAGKLELEGFPRNLFETGLRLVILLGYMILVSQMKDIKRTFAYHGAEHKTIACYEAGEELTVENARRHSRFHPRCGTSFLLMVVLVSMLTFLLVTLPLQMLEWDNNFLRVGVRLMLLPFVVAISYEVNRLIGRSDSLLSRIIRSPGLWMQRITTVEPEDGMLEAAIEALKRVMPEEEGKDEWGT